MRGKLLFITGGLIGYVLGARAGRKRYDQIAAAATDLWNAKPVQRRVTEVRDFALDAVGDVPSQLIGAGKKAYAAMQEKAERGKAGRATTTSDARTAGEKAAQAAAQATAQATAEAAAKSRPAKPGTTTPAATPATPAPDSAEPTAN